MLAPVYVGLSENQLINTILRNAISVKNNQLILFSMYIFTVTNVKEIVTQKSKNIEYPE